MIYQTKRDRAEEARQIFSNSEFKEEDHPRAEDGKFGKGGGGRASDKKVKKERKILVTPENKEKVSKQAEYAENLFSLAKEDMEKTEGMTIEQLQRYSNKLRSNELDTFAQNAFNFISKNIDAKYAKEKLKDFNENYGGMSSLGKDSAIKQAQFLKDMYNEIVSFSDPKENSSPIRIYRASK